ILWSPATGAHPTYGGIGARWRSMGFENGVLGYPVTGEICGLKDGGCYQKFQGGDILWSPTTGAHPTYGAIGARWRSMGAENGAFGYPLTGETCGLPDGGCSQRFQGGTINFSLSRGTFLS
ncbi:hypothetical protein, partial [Arthrobacter sp. H41]|uniref:hypothetical protein n=1 Tax=Arthrobacter sp. H41 TaxID=1312978 RepID=UPI00047A65A5